MTTTRFLLCAISGVAILLMASAARCAEPKGTAKPADDFDGVISPLITQFCVTCHGTKPEDSTLSLTMPLAAQMGTNSISHNGAIWQAVLEKLSKNEMPPEGKPQPDSVMKRKAIDWLTSKLMEAGSAATVGILPSDGNKVDHSALFHAPNPPPLDNPPRLWRLSPEQYMQWADEITRAAHLVRHSVKGVTQPFPSLEDTGFRNYALVFPLDEPTTDQLIRNAQNLAALQTGWRMHQGRKRMILWNKKIKHTTEITRLGDPNLPPPTRDEMQAGVRAEFNFALYREPTEEELSRYTDLMEQKVATLGREDGVSTALAMILLLPEAVFRSERGEGKPDTNGRVMLSPRELAYALSFALTDTRPSPGLLQRVADGQLNSENDVRHQVREMLADKALPKPTIFRFFREYFGYDRALKIFKDDSANPNHDALVLVRDTDYFVKHILDEDRDVLRALLTSSKSFVQIVPRTKTEGGEQKAGRRQVWTSYNLDARPESQPVELPAVERAGMLMQPSWLVAWSANTENHPIHRGKWIREKLLGGSIPDVPIGVDARLPEDPDKTLRERMEVTNDAKCVHCHRKMNPLGLPFEQFDHFGRYRTKELERPVVTSGSITDTDLKTLDGDVSDPVQMMKKLADSEHVRQVFVRHAFRYWMGRNENLGDARTLRNADQAYVASGGSMNALIESLLTSESFLYRTVKPTVAPIKTTAK